MKKIIAAMVAILLFIPFSSINGNKISLMENEGSGEDILYVGGNGEDNYTTIQEAIDAATNGYTIYVYPGNYNESIVINKSISLVGIKKEGERPIIDGGGNEEGTTVLIEANNCTLLNLIIRGGLYGIETKEVDFITIENNVVEYAGLGIEIHSSNTMIRNNTITKSGGIGVYTHDNTFNITLTRNLMVENGGNGVQMRGNNHIISHNNITKNCDGIDMDNAHNCIISFNHVHHNWQYGITLFASSNISIFNNTIHHHAYGGLFLADSSYCSVYRNEMYENQAGVMMRGTLGINFKGSINNIVTNNSIYSNSIGVYMEFHCEDNRIAYNNIVNNDRNAYFWFYKKPFLNMWDRNYWSDWTLESPKPIIGILDVIMDVFIFYFIFPIPWLMFDKHPAMEPYEIS